MALSATDEFKITQIVDNGQIVQLTLIENVSTEPISQKQMIIENVSKRLDAETKEQVMPLLEAILQAQPTGNIFTNKNRSFVTKNFTSKEGKFCKIFQLSFIVYCHQNLFRQEFARKK